MGCTKKPNLFYFVGQSEMAYIKDQTSILHSWYPPNGYLFSPFVRKIERTDNVIEILQTHLLELDDE